MKRSIAAALALPLALLCACSGGPRAPRRAQVDSEERQFQTPAEGDLIAIFATSLGEVRAVLYPDAAPMAVENFAGLARTGYYDGTRIWRVEYGFAVQGGDATGQGNGGGTIYSNNALPLEADPALRHYAGALCAAWAQGSPNDASGVHIGGNSQFYFVTALPDSVGQEAQAQLAANGYPQAQIDAYAAAGGLPYLDNTDTVFGQVYAGMEVVDAMACVPTEKAEDGTDTFRPAGEDAPLIQGILITTYPGPDAEQAAALIEAGASPAPAASAAPSPDGGSTADTGGAEGADAVG